VSGGYSILREHSLPPLNLTVPESLAVLAGLGLLETSPYGAAARRARVKVLAISREDQLASVAEALASMFVIDSQPPTEAEAAISLIPEAIAARRIVRLGYTSEDGETRTTRDVEAMGLLRGGDAWVFVGWCRLREGIRGFHLDRIRHLEITEEVFPERDPAVLDADLSRWRTRRLG
jgi:proteasome accessory factor B